MATKQTSTGVKMVSRGISQTCGIIPYPNGTDVKQKHYWIYSDGPNWGKTTNGKALAEKYRCQCVDANEGYKGLYDFVPLFVFDNYSRDNCIEKTLFKTITSGRANTAALPSDEYGKSFTFHEHAQFIIFSRYSPYEVYAEMDDGFLCISPQMCIHIENTFNITKLDVEVEQDKLVFHHPKYLLPEGRLDRLAEILLR